MLTAGTLLQGRYRIVEPLSEGGMSVVYLAVDAVLGNRVAVKEMKDYYLSPPEREMAAHQFLKEAQILASLEHVGLPRVTNFFQESGKHYLIMDFIDGDTLEALAARSGGTLPEETVLRVAAEVCRVLDYLHNVKPAVIFRDMKPSNIMLTRDGRVKLIDFGISKNFDAGGLTRTIIKGAGTPGFAPPEQYGTQGQRRTDARSDVYSLGATMYALLTGQIPTEATDRWMNGIPLLAPTSLNPLVDAQTEALILAMMELRPDDRPASARAVLEAIRKHRPDLAGSGAAGLAYAPLPGGPVSPPVAPPAGDAGRALRLEEVRGAPGRRFPVAVPASDPLATDDAPTSGIYPFAGAAHLAHGPEAAPAAGGTPLAVAPAAARGAPVAGGDALATAEKGPAASGSRPPAELPAAASQAAAGPAAALQPIEAPALAESTETPAVTSPSAEAPAETARSDPSPKQAGAFLQHGGESPSVEGNGSSPPPAASTSRAFESLGMPTVLRAAGAPAPVRPGRRAGALVAAVVFLFSGLLALGVIPLGGNRPSPRSAATSASPSAATASTAPAASPTARPSPDAAARPVTRLTVASDPAGAMIYLDGRRVGETGRDPLLLETSARAHTVKLKKDGYLTRVVHAAPGEGQQMPLAVRLVPESKVKFEVSPPEARIVFAGRVVGHGSASVGGLRRGTYSYRVSAPGYYERKGRVELGEGEIRPLTIGLLAVARPVPHYVPAEPPVVLTRPSAPVTPRYAPPVRRPTPPRATPRFIPPPRATPRYVPPRPHARPPSTPAGPPMPPPATPR